MSSRTKGRTVRGWDIAVAAAILAVVLLGWLTSLGGGGAPASKSGQLVVPARLSARPGPGGGSTGQLHIAPRPPAGNGGAVASDRRTRR